METKTEKRTPFQAIFRIPIFSSLYEKTLSKIRNSSSFFCGKLEKDTSLPQARAYNRHNLSLRILTILTIYLQRDNFEKDGVVFAINDICGVCKKRRMCEGRTFDATVIESPQFEFRHARLENGKKWSFAAYSFSADFGMHKNISETFAPMFEISTAFG